MNELGHIDARRMQKMKVREQMRRRVFIVVGSLKGPKYWWVNE